MIDSKIEGSIIFIVLILVDALFYGFASAIQCVSKSNIEKRAEEDKDPKSIILNKMIDNPTNFINTIQVIVNTVSILAGIFQVEIFSRAFLNWFVSKSSIPAGYEISMLVRIGTQIAIFIIIVFLLLTFGILVPKKLGQKYSEGFAYSLVKLMNLVVILFTPLTFVINKATNATCRIFGVDPNTLEDDVTEEEIRSLVNEVHEQGVLLASEAEMINNIFEFGDKEAKDIMTHRKNIVAINGDLTISEALKYILKQNYSRFPVYEDNIDNIIGVVNLKDIMIAYSNNTRVRSRQLKSLKVILRDAAFIPETRNINVLFKSMQSQKIHMVVVVDEYGQTSGIVAMEDILEEIVGNILDEYDKDDVMIQRQSEGVYIIDGMADLEDLEDVLGISFETEDEIETLNGFLISKLDRIPNEDEAPVIEYADYIFKVLKVENKMIKTIEAAKTS